MKFDELKINPCLLKAVEKLGFTDMTDVQEKVIPVALDGFDLIGQAPTGTGKTCAYGLPILDSIDLSLDKVQYLILAPTRELALQITSDLNDFSCFMKNVKCVTVYGGEQIEKQIISLKKHPQIVVATPGRLIDHLNRHTIKLNDIKAVILDEADEMLNMGFREDVDTILSNVSVEHQTMLFSATFPKEIEEICLQYLKDPKHIKVMQKSLTVDTVKQFYCLSKEKDKIEVMSRIIDLNGFKNVMVFCNTKKGVDEVTSSLLQRGYIVEGLHGDMKQLQRDRVMRRFRDGLINILVCSDVAARGLDINGLDAVLNYDIPDDEEYYIHRIGRTGRAKNDGIAITFINTNEKYRLRSIINYTKAEINKMEIPDLREVLNIRIERLINNAIEKVFDNSISNNQQRKLIQKQVSKEIEEKMIQPEDIITGLILSNLEETQEVEEIYERGTVANSSSGRCFINLGKSHGINSYQLKDLINGVGNIKINDIKNMEVHDDFSFFEVPKDRLDSLIDAFSKQKFGNKRIIVEAAKQKDNKHKSNKTHGKDNKSRENKNKGGNKSHSKKQNKK